MSLTYKCSGCGNVYPANIPAFEEIIKNGVCPICGEQIVIINFEKDSTVNWYEEAFEIFPSVISYEYRRLYNLSRTNNTYGLILEIKDCIETIIKFCTLSACAWGKENQIPGAKTTYEKELTNELLLSDWYEILRLIKVFYNDDERKKAGIQLPPPLKKLVDKVLYWVKHENKDLVKWRNDTIGHGALALEDDPDLKKDIVEKLNYISEFLRTNSDTISKIRIICEGEEKKGYASARDFETESGPCFLKIDDETISFDPYIIHVQHGLFFYDSLVRQRQAKLLNYPTGQSKLQYNQYILELHDLLKDKGSLMKRNLDSGILTLREYNYLARLSINESYVRPESIIHWLDQSIQKHSKGVFLLEMDRGCGKTFFTEKLNRRFSSPQEIDNGYIDVRTIHLSKAQTSGISRFLSDLTWEWRLAFSQDEVILESRNMPLPDEDPSYNAVFLADFLNAWRKDTENYRGKSKILLVLDGLDEISPSADLIWSYIPKEQMLDNGVYILLSSRTRNQIPNEIKLKIDSLQVQESLAIQASSDEYKKTLKAFVKSKKIKGISEDDIETLIKKSNYRLLTLSMLCRLAARFGRDLTHLDSEEDIASCYLLSIEELYGERRLYTFRTLLTVLATFGSFDMLSLQEISELLQMDHIQFELLDMMADLQPLLIVERGYLNDEKEEADVNRYHFANEDVATNVINYVGKETAQERIADLITSVMDELASQLGTPQYAEGILCLIAHIHTVSNTLGLNITWSARDVENFLTYAKAIYLSNPDRILFSARYYSVLMECFQICKGISFDQLESIPEQINEMVHALETQYTSNKMLANAIEVLDFGLRFHLSQKRKNNLEIYSLLKSICKLYIQRNNYKEADKQWKQLNDTAKYIELDNQEKADLYLLRIKILMILPGAKKLEIPNYTGKVIQAIRSIPSPSFEAYLIQVEAEYSNAVFLRETMQEQDAIYAFEKNLEDCRNFEKRFPGHFIEWTAHNLNSYGGLYKQKGEITGNRTFLEKSEQMRMEAFRILEKLYEKDRRKYEQDFALNCNTLGNIYRLLGRYEESKTYHHKAMVIREELFKMDSQAFGAELAHSYKNYGHALGENDEYPLAIEYLNKAISGYKALTNHHTEEKNIWLTAAYLNLFDVYAESGDRINAVLALKEISRTADNYAWIKDTQLDRIPQFVQQEPKPIKNPNFEALTSELEHLVKIKETIQGQTQKRNYNLRCAYLCFEIYMIQPNISNAMDCIRTGRNYLETLSERATKDQLFSILGDLAGFVLNVDIKTRTKNKEECLQIADMYENIQTILANFGLLQFAIDFAKLALSAYLDYERIDSAKLKNEIVDRVCTLYNNIGEWTNNYLKKDSEAIRYLEKAAEYAKCHMNEDRHFALYYAASNTNIMTTLMNPNVHDYKRAEQIASKALKTLDGFYGYDGQTDDQIIGINLFLLYIHANEKDRYGIHRQGKTIKNLLQSNKTLPRERINQYLLLIKRFQSI